MKFTVRHLLPALLLALALPALGAPPVDPLDAKYGVASQPAYIKHYEADKTRQGAAQPVPAGRQQGVPRHHRSQGRAL